MNRMTLNLAFTGLLTQHADYCATKCLLHSQMDHKPVNAVCQRRSVDRHDGKVQIICSVPVAKAWIKLYICNLMFSMWQVK